MKGEGEDMNKTTSGASEIFIPRPDPEQLCKYRNQWEHLEKYPPQEKAIRRLFRQIAPENEEITDVLLKVAVLNAFYSTNLYDAFSVALHIQNLHIDKLLKLGDVALVEKLRYIHLNGRTRDCYSFATKYCHCHSPLVFPIYDRYVDKMLCYFGKHDRFADFREKDLKDYRRLKEILENFRAYYGLDSYTLEDLDKYLWLLGKEYLPKKLNK